MAHERNVSDAPTQYDRSSLDSVRSQNEMLELKPYYSSPYSEHRASTSYSRNDIDQETLHEGSSTAYLNSPKPYPQFDGNTTGFAQRSKTVRRVRDGLARTKTQWTRGGRPKVGVLKSLKSIALSSPLNVCLIFIPLSWTAHFLNEKDHDHNHHITSWATFFLSFFAIIPLVKLFEYGGDQLSFYVGPNIGDLIIVFLHNAVEATLGVILLTKCRLRLLQSTLIGVVLLRLLLIPGIAYLVGGVRVLHQEIHPDFATVNHALLVVGVLSLVLPVAFFNVINSDVDTPSTSSEIAERAIPFAGMDDNFRNTILTLSRIFAIILLTVYLASRIYMHNPPGNSDETQEKVPRNRQEKVMDENQPEVNPWVCIVMLLITIGLMATTAEWLVDSVEFVREEGHLNEEFFGLILLPVVSFSADAAVTLGYFLRYLLKHFLGNPKTPSMMAHVRGIDLSIQFTLFWIPLIILIGWWTGKPASLLFDTFEVTSVVAACFIVNFVTADSRTNWAEGYAMMAFYVMIAACAFFYSGEKHIETMDVCTSIALSLAGGGEKGESTKGS